MLNGSPNILGWPFFNIPVWPAQVKSMCGKRWNKSRVIKCIFFYCLKPQLHLTSKCQTLFERHDDNSWHVSVTETLTD